MKKIMLISSFAIYFSLFSCSSQYQKEEKNNVLLELINKRLEIAPLVAKSKWNTKTPINDSIREKLILDSVESKALKIGVDKDFARDFFQAQFEAGKKVQVQLHEKWSKETLPPFAPSINLATEVRPILDSLTPLLLLELKKIESSNNRHSLDNLRKSARKIINDKFDEDVMNTAVKPIELYFHNFKNQ